MREIKTLQFLVLKYFANDFLFGEIVRVRPTVYASKLDVDFMTTPLFEYNDDLRWLTKG